VSFKSGRLRKFERSWPATPLATFVQLIRTSYNVHRKHGRLQEFNVEMWSSINRRSAASSLFCTSAGLGAVVGLPRLGNLCHFDRRHHLVNTTIQGV
jgi:hypothetical protein